MLNKQPTSCVVKILQGQPREEEDLESAEQGDLKFSLGQKKQKDVQGLFYSSGFSAKS